MHNTEVKINAKSLTIDSCQSQKYHVTENERLMVTSQHI